jgi:hypothetical protein
MNLQTIIKKSVKGNSKGFGSYFLAVSFSVFVIFVLALLTYHPDIPLNTMRMDFQKGAKAVQMMLSYICQNAQMEKNANPTRTVRL